MIDTRAVAQEVQEQLLAAVNKSQDQVRKAQEQVRKAREQVRQAQGQAQRPSARALNASSVRGSCTLLIWSLILSMSGCGTSGGLAIWMSTE